MDQQIARTQGRIEQGLGQQRYEAQTQELLSRPALENAKLAEQERDNLRALYEKQPYFDAVNNPEHRQLAEQAAKLGLQLPNRRGPVETFEGMDAQGNTVLYERDPVSGASHPAMVNNQPLIRKPAPEKVGVDIDGRRLTVTPAEALGYYGQIGRQDRETEGQIGRSEAERRALQTKMDQAKTAADSIQQQIAQLDEAAKQITSYVPLTQIDKETGALTVVKNPDGSIAYDTKAKSPERLQYEQQRKALQEQLEVAQREWNTANIALQGVYTPSGLNRNNVPKAPKGMGLSRRTFIKNNPSLEGKSDAEIDQILISNGYKPLP
jgi:phage-related minor tail protein